MDFMIWFERTEFKIKPAERFDNNKNVAELYDVTREAEITGNENFPFWIASKWDTFCAAINLAVSFFVFS